ncbi:MAG: transposase [Planctomycetota bacterium]
MATGEGSIALHVPQTRDGVEPFQTRVLETYRRRSETLEALIPQLDA